MSKIEQLKKEISQRENELAKLREDYKAALKNKFLECYHCKALSKIGNLIYIQTYWYEQPYSCTGGDRWHQGEGNVICPKCNKTIRFIGKLFGKYLDEFPKLKYSFKAIEDRYGN